MFQEYAVEPRALAVSWINAKYLIEKFGLEQGRLISEFPRKWLKEVYSASGNWKPVERKKLEEKLKQVKSVIFSIKYRSYDSQKGNWLTQALEQHKIDPFHAIIVKEKPVQFNAAYLEVSEIEENHGKFQVDRSQKILRVGTEIAKALEELLGSAQVIQFVDPFFSDQDKYRKTLKACLKLLNHNRINEIKCEIHHCNEKFGYRVHDCFKANKKVIEGVIPDGLCLEFFTWKEFEFGEDFHDRYLLTDRGGVILGAGFSEEGAGENVEITLLQNRVSKLTQQNFVRNSKIYDLILPVARVFSDGKVVIDE